ncbi:hypothetical protein [Alcaligenes faecalis]|uniref:hypothetical protein n=1 Tax=Alcaligenes faecalis TaxID=511 RepID=UPI0006919083|nr:hypothetical protein [Alcaligenes faecalis]
MKLHYTDIRLGAKRRLAMLRKRADELNQRHPTMPGNATWRDVRHCGFHNHRESRCELSPTEGKGAPRWYCHAGPAFEREIFVDESEEARIDHTGWFADTWQDNVIRGLIVRLPHGRFLVGHYEKDSGERVYYSELYDDERTAVYRADSLAQRVAEEETEYHRRDQEARVLAEEVSESRARLRECIVLRNHKCFPNIRGEVPILVNTIRTTLERLADEFSDIDYSDALEA